MTRLIEIAEETIAETLRDDIQTLLENAATIVPDPENPPAADTIDEINFNDCLKWADRLSTALVYYGGLRVDLSAALAKIRRFKANQKPLTLTSFAEELEYAVDAGMGGLSLDREKCEALLTVIEQAIAGLSPVRETPDAF